jgi:hypothetical protein
MFFSVKNNKYLSDKQLRADTLMNAYFVVSNYPLKASDLILNDYLVQQHKINLKNLCVKLLLEISFLKNDEGDFILMFKDPKLDSLAQLITYGNGAIPGSRILQLALKSN